MAKTPAPSYYEFACVCGNSCNFDEKPESVLCTACGNVTEIA